MSRSYNCQQGRHPLCTGCDCQCHVGYGKPIKPDSGPVFMPPPPTDTSGDITHDTLCRIPTCSELATSPQLYCDAHAAIYDNATSPSGQDELRAKLLGKIELAVRTEFFNTNIKNMEFLADDIVALITTHETQLLTNLLAEKEEWAYPGAPGGTSFVIPVSAVERVIKELKGGV